MPKLKISRKEMCDKDFSEFEWIPYCENYQFYWKMGKADFEIISPVAGVYFSDGYNESFGTQMTIYPEFLQNYRLKTDLANTNNDTIPIIVKFEFLGNVQYDTTFVTKPSIRVSLYPQVIAPGDTADIYIEQWNSYSNTYEEISYYQQYEIGIIGGCDYGNILYESELKSYYEKISGYTMFVASDSLDLDSIEVSIRVNLIEEDTGGGEWGITVSNESKIEEMKKQNSSKKDAEIGRLNTSLDNKVMPVKENMLIRNVNTRIQKRVLNISAEMKKEVFQRQHEKEQNLTAGVLACANMDVGDLTGVGDAIIKSACSEFTCNEDPKLPKFDVIEINKSNASESEKIMITEFCEKDYGFFSPIYMTFEDSDNLIEMCFNQHKGTWQFNYQKPILLRAFLTFCPNRFSDEGIIESIEDVWKIPENKLCKAYADFKAQKTYGASVEFIIFEALMKHERVHKDHFFNAIWETLYHYPKGENVEKFSSLFINSKHKCEDTPNLDEAIRKGQMEFEYNIYDFSNHLIKVFGDIIGEKGTEKNNSYERETTHQDEKVQKVINDYIKEIEERIDKINNTLPKKSRIKC